MKKRKRTLRLQHKLIFGLVVMAALLMAALSGVYLSMDMVDRQTEQLILTTLLVVCIVLAISVILYYFYIRRILILPLSVLYRATHDLVENNLENLGNFWIEIGTGDELDELGQSFQYMTTELHDYMQNQASVTAEKERNRAELDVAAHIQASMLPDMTRVSPKYPKFDIYASMTPAKEVGGDFYDCFLVDDDHLALVIADVSGKGVPAALFMVVAKTLLKSTVQTGLSPKEALEKVNNQLCENNDAEMFVTVWLGIYQISTGRIVAANAGHEQPALRRADGSFELVRDRHGFVLAGIENSRYQEYELTLEPDDRLFVYTDGVAEATDANGELYGTERMLAALNRNRFATSEELLKAVREDIDRFVAEAPQFDDITMLSIQRKKAEEKE